MPEINDRKHAFVERVGAECVEADIPFFLELVSYGEGMEGKGPEFARLKPVVVAHGMQESSKPQYRVDVLKVGVPVNMEFVEGSQSLRGEVLYCRSEAIAHYRRAASLARITFIYLPEGVSNETFQFALELATEAGVTFSGVSCGRAKWQEGVPIFARDAVRALDEWLLCKGVQNVKNVNRRLNAAHSWFSVSSQHANELPAGRMGKRHS